MKLSGFLFTVLILFFYSCKVVQKTTPIAHTECDSLYFDLDTGMINSVSPMLPQSDIKEWFGCFTGYSPDGSPSNCGGGVRYKAHGFSYFTYFDYVEVDSTFKGKVTNGLLNAAKEEVRKHYPDPVATKYTDEFPEVDFFVTPYGCLKFEYGNNKVVKISAHYTECSNVDICR